MNREPIDEKQIPPQTEDAPLEADGKRGPPESAQDGSPGSQAPTSEVEQTVGERETPSPAGPDTAAWALQAERLQAILDLWERFRAQLQNTENTIGEVKRSQELQAAKLRELSDKLDDVATSLSEPRIREVLTSLLLLHDLLDQMAGTAAETEPEAVHCRNYGVVLSQILQILALHGIETIPTDIPFDEGLHSAMQRRNTDDPSEDGRIVRVFRKGFKSQRRVLRYADVEVLAASPAGDDMESENVKQA